MKKLLLIVISIIATGMVYSQLPVENAVKVGLKAAQGVRASQSSLQNIQTKVQSRALATAGASVYYLQPSTLSVHQTSASTVLSRTISPDAMVCPLMLSTVKTLEEQEISYKKEKVTERKGGGSMTMYHLMVTNHSSKNLYVFGSVHIIGEVEQEGRHFAGSVPAHSTKCLLTTVDEDFNGVRISWQDDM